jgi:RNA polymerase sigma factor (sigma-70 family)
LWSVFTHKPRTKPVFVSRSILPRCATLLARTYLVSRIRAGESDALLELAERFQGQVVGYLRKHYGDALNDEDIADAFEQGLTRVWMYAHSFGRKPGTLKSWFMTICQHEAFDIITDKKERQDVEFELEWHDRREECEEEELSEEDRQELDDLHQAISMLPEQQKKVIMADMKSPEGVASDKQVAKILKTTDNAVAQARIRGKANIAKYMAQIQEARTKGGVT